MGSLGRGNLLQDLEREREWAVYAVSVAGLPGLMLRSGRLYGKGTKRWAETQPHWAFGAVPRSLASAVKYWRAVTGFRAGQRQDLICVGPSSSQRGG